MKIYVGHSKDMNYMNDLYKPIRELEKNIEDTFYFPHERLKNNNHDRGFCDDFDLFLAEVSVPAIGLGIELGWASDRNIPIYCLYKKGKKVSNSLKSVTNNFYEYETAEDLTNQILKIIAENKKVLKR